MSRGFLLDTNVLIWIMQDSGHLSRNQIEIIDAGHDLVVSVVSLWEIAIKESLGKLKIDGDPTDEISRRNIPIIGVEIRHIRQLGDLPHHHRDPFDRMLIAQAQVEKLTILTADRNFDTYDVRLL